MILFALLAAVQVFLRSRSQTALEVLALRQQVAVLKRKRPRPLLNSFDRLFWTTLRRVWSRWSEVLVIVKPETVVGWHRASFRLYWRWRSRPHGGRPKITEEIRGLIRRMAEENAAWGAPKIQGELLKLGFVVSERTMARLSPESPRGDRCVRLLHRVDGDLPVALPLGIAERWAGSCRREILDHVIALNEQHLRRLIRDYVNYYHQDRIHDSLKKDTPDRRPIERKPAGNATVISNARLGGLHHRYSWREAA